MFEEFRELKKQIPTQRDEFDELIDEIKKEEKFGIKQKILNSNQNEDNINLNYVEVVLNLFTIENGIIKVLLLKKQEEPYKGHWILPNKLLTKKNNVDMCINDIIYFQLKLDDIYIKQSNFMSNINTENSGSVILSYLGIINIEQFKKYVNKELEYGWFPIDGLPKIAYDYNRVIRETNLQLKEVLVKLNNIKMIFKENFSISELQNIYEILLNQKFDRRNFRKKFVRAGIVEETGEINEIKNGRPAKLYKFKEKLEDINLF